MKTFFSTTFSALLPVRNHLVDRCSRSQAIQIVSIRQSARTLPGNLHIQADLAPPSVGRYQMKGDLQPADVTLHDAHLAATPTGSSVPCTTTMMFPHHLSDAANCKPCHTKFI